MRKGVWKLGVPSDSPADVRHTSPAVALRPVRSPEPRVLGGRPGVPHGHAVIQIRSIWPGFGVVFTKTTHRHVRAAASAL